LEKILPEYLKGKRWFSSKAYFLKNVSVIDLLCLGSQENNYYFVVFRADLEPQGEATYFTVFRKIPVSDESHSRVSAEGHEIVDKLAEFKDPLDDPVFINLVVQSFINSRVVKGPEASIVFSLSGLGEMPTDHYAVTEIKSVNAEQSNTSIIIERKYILKLYRNSKFGENPDYAVPLQLYRNSFRNTPAPLGLCTLEKHGSRRDLISLFQFIPDSRDCWSLMTESLIRYLTMPEERELSMNTCSSLSRDLGKLTADLHLSLSTVNLQDFIPSIPGRDDLMMLSFRMEKLQNDTVALLERVFSSTGKMSPSAFELAGLLKRSNLKVLESLKGELKMRIHGDYHLGQVLRSNGMLYVIDFEGEPSKTMLERNEKWFPEKDVAGMLRSLDYAVSFSLKNSANLGIASGDADALSRHLREIFLQSYLKNTNKGVFLKRKGDVFKELVSYFSIEKALYELAYELNNRPDWVDIPMKYLLKTLRQD
jgi:maltose alpha-D-glucosyltransferase/alpha-amylase